MQRAATLAATADALTSGSTQDNLSEADKVVSEGNAELAARMKENPELDASAWVEDLLATDDHGLLSWCIRGAGQFRGQFNALRQSHPQLWQLCQHQLTIKSALSPMNTSASSY